jgi:hypothetical protein
MDSFVHVRVERFPYGHVEDNVNGSGTISWLQRVR